MARFDPGVKVLPHDVAIGAGGGVVGEVGSALGIDKGIAPRTGREADGEGDEQADKSEGPLRHSSDVRPLHAPILALASPGFEGEGGVEALSFC